MNVFAKIGLGPAKRRDKVSIKWSVKINKPELFAQKQRKPEIHLFVLNVGGQHNDAAYHQRKIFPLEFCDYGKEKTYELNLSLAQLQTNSVLAVDMYVETENGQGVWCKMHKGVANVFFKQVLEELHSTKQTSLTTKIMNTKVEDEVCSISFNMSDILNRSIGISGQLMKFPGDKMYYEDKELEESITNQLVKMIKAELGLFTGWYSMRSVNSFMTRVHAPVYNSRIGSLVGFAYVMNSDTLPADESWFLHHYNNALFYCNKTDEGVSSAIQKQMRVKNDELSEEFYQAVELYATMLVKTGWSLVYETDFYVKNGKNKSYESFDNADIRNCGDCEDLARRMHFVHNTFINSKFENVGLKQLQKVGGMFISGVVLGQVSQNAHGFSIFKSRQAHMYVKLIPKKYFVENITFVKDQKHNEITLDKIYNGEGHPWMDKLNTFVLEGTAPVEPFPAIKVINKRAERLKQVVEVEGVAQKVPKRMTRVFRPTWGNFQDSFYEIDGHIYTDQFIQAGINIGSFAIYNSKKKEYGVPFQQVLDQENVSFMPHQIASDENIKLLKSLLEYDAPTPKLAASYKTEEWKQDTKYKTFVESLSTVQEPASAYYNDYVIQRPLEVTEEEYAAISKFLNEKSKHIIVRGEGTRKGLYTLNIRAYLIPK